MEKSKLYQNHEQKNDKVINEHWKLTLPVLLEILALTSLMIKTKMSNDEIKWNKNDRKKTNSFFFPSEITVSVTKCSETSSYPSSAARCASELLQTVSLSARLCFWDQVESESSHSGFKWTFVCMLVCNLMPWSEPLPSSSDMSSTSFMVSGTFILCFSVTVCSTETKSLLYVSVNRPSYSSCPALCCPFS